MLKRYIFSTDENFKKSSHLFTLIFYTLLIMYCYAKQCYLATSYLLLSCYATACKHIVSRWTLPIIWYTLLVSVMVSNRNSYFAIACRAFPTIVSYVYHAPWWKHDYTATKAMDILLYTTHYSSDLFRSLHYYRPGLIIPTRKLNVLVINVFFYFYSSGSQPLRWRQPNPYLQFC